MTSPRLLGTERIGPHHQLNRIRRCALPTLPPEAIPGSATLAPWFRCGWLVQRSLGLFGPARRVITADAPDAGLASSAHGFQTLLRQAISALIHSRGTNLTEAKMSPKAKTPTSITSYSVFESKLQASHARLGRQHRSPSYSYCYRGLVSRPGLCFSFTDAP